MPIQPHIIPVPPVPPIPPNPPAEFQVNLFSEPNRLDDPNVLLGDCVELLNSLPAESVDLVFADPPYNMQLGGILHRPNQTVVDGVEDEWDKFGSSAQESFRAYDDFTRNWLTAVKRVMKDNATLWVIGSYHNIYRVGAILMDLDFWILNDVVWIKSNPMPQMHGVRMCNAHETMLWVKKAGQGKYTFNYKGLKSGNEDLQMRSDWYFPICLGSERMVEEDGKKSHSTQKPEALLQRIITSTSHRGDLILDPFCGSGTTAAVAKRLGRRYLTIDREEKYVELAKRRLADVIVTKADPPTNSIDAPPTRIAFAEMVERGEFKVGQQLRSSSTGRVATINEDGTIAVDGLHGSIHKIGAKVQNHPACNGWTEWQYFDEESGEWVLIDKVRRRVGGSHQLW